MAPFLSGFFSLGPGSPKPPPFAHQTTVSTESSSPRNLDQLVFCCGSVVGCVRHVIVESEAAEQEVKWPQRARASGLQGQGQGRVFQHCAGVANLARKHWQGGAHTLLQ